ncbi:MAG TPA: BPTI/Kunitz domain-containing protein [Polyangiaceae bacterium]|nr:BPTI/Kunitz domain-containing protein [Polyangiaceae bacterium]
MSLRKAVSRAPLTLAGLVTLLFVGCSSETQVLNDPGVATGGEEGVGPSAGGAPPTAGKAASAGKTSVSSTAGKGGGAPHGSPSSLPLAGSTSGGSSGAGGTLGDEVGGTSIGTGLGGSNPGFAGSSGSAGSAGGPLGGTGPGYGGTVGTVAGASGFSGSAGSSNGGVGNTGNTGGRNSAGSAGGPGYVPTCNSTSGYGCTADELCVEVGNQACTSGRACNGYCESPVPSPACADSSDCPAGLTCLPDPTSGERRCIGDDTPSCGSASDCPHGFDCAESRCVPLSVGCADFSGCPGQTLPDCPVGYTPALDDACVSPCVPMDRCGCADSVQCAYPSTCDLTHGSCAIPAELPGCQDAWDPGTCTGSFQVFAFVDGRCQPKVYGGCDGNGNRFSTLEECLDGCEGLPRLHACPAGRTAAHVCLACSASAGCQLFGDFCAQTCANDRDCTTAGQTCNPNGVCEAQNCN